MPGNNGGANWGGAAVDPVNGLLFVVSKDLPAMLKLAKDPEADKALAASAGERYYSGFGFMIASDGLSPIAPPWTSLTAYDLNKGTIQWKIPARRSSALGGEGIQEHRNSLPEGRARRNSGRTHLHRHARQESARARCRQWKGPMGA